MALDVTTKSGDTVKAASSAQGTLGVTLGAIGTGLALLGGNGLNGILGNGVVATANGTVINGECLVSKDQFYQTLLQQVNDQSARDLAAERRMSSIEATVSQNAAVSACNKDAIRREIEVTQNTFDMVISNERLMNELILKNALCRVPQGDVYLSPTKLADNYIAPSRILDSYVPRDYMPGAGGWAGYHKPCGFDGGCSPCAPYFGGF